MPLSCTGALAALQIRLPQTLRRPCVETAEAAGSLGADAAVSSTSSPPQAASSAVSSAVRRSERSDGKRDFVLDPFQRGGFREATNSRSASS